MLLKLNYMRKFLILTAFTFLTASSFAQENNWKEFSSEECNFSASMPNLPDISKDSVFAQGMTLNIIDYSTWSNSQVSFRITCSDFPISQNLTSNRQRFLTLKQGALPNFDGEIMDIKDLELEKHFGISYTERSDMFTIYYQNILVEDKILQMHVSGLEHDAKEEGEKFYSSISFN